VSRSGEIQMSVDKLGLFHEQLPQTRWTALPAGIVTLLPAGYRPRRSVSGVWSNGNLVVLP
jgi:hypothetical protein